MRAWEGPGWTVINGNALLVGRRVQGGQGRQDVAQKPVEDLRQLVRLAPMGGLVVDPFGGSGSTGEAALLEGRRVVLIEQVPEWAQMCADRCRAAVERSTCAALRAGQAGLFG